MIFCVHYNFRFLFISCIFIVINFLLIFHSSNSFSAEWSFQPSLSIRQTYTDNVRLGGLGGLGGVGLGGLSSDGKQDDFITQINPRVSFTGKSRRYQIDSSYRMNNLIFAKNSNLNRIRHQLNANATAELLEDLFFIDGLASIRQQNATLFGAQTTDNINVTGNRRDVRRYSISPYVRYRFGNLASTELRYTYGIVESSAGGLRNSQRNGYQASLTSGDYFRVLSWGLNFSHRRIHFDGNQLRPARTIELERSIGNLRYNITRRFGLTASGGYERNSFISIRGKPSSPTWTVGFIWVPNKRTEISGSAGKRFFGDTYAANIKYRTRMTTWEATYTEDITTFNQQGGGGFGGGFGGFGGFGGSVLGGNNFLTNRLFLLKSARASVTINGRRNTLGFRFYHRSRKAFSPESDDEELVGIENAGLLNNTTQIGGNIIWSYKISPLTSLSFTASYLRIKFLSGQPSNRNRNNMIFTTNLSKRFGESLTGALRYRFIQRTFSGNDAQANSITASVNMNF